MSALSNALANPFTAPFLSSHGVPGNWWPAGAVMAADFSGGRYVVDGLPVTEASLIANASASGGYVPSSDGHITLIGPNLPRIGSGTGLLIEEERTNICLQSNAFNVNPWNTVQGLANPVQNVTGPDNVLNSAWTFTDNSGQHEILRQEFSASNNLTYSLSIYVLKDSDETRFPSVLLSLLGATTLHEQVHINTATGAGTEESPNTDGTFTVVDAGAWWRLELSLTNNATGNTTLRLDIQPARGTVFGLNSAAAQGSAVFFGCQVEIAAFSTSYIATGASATARSTDSVTFNDISWFQEDVGTFLVEFTPLDDDTATKAILQADDGTDAERVGIQQISGADVRTVVTNLGATSAQLDATSALTVGVQSKVAVAWETDAGQSVDGSAAVTDGTVVAPTGINEINIGHRAGGAIRMSAGRYGLIAYWDERKPDDFLQSISK